MNARGAPTGRRAAIGPLSSRSASDHAAMVREAATTRRNSPARTVAGYRRPQFQSVRREPESNVQVSVWRHRFGAMRALAAVVGAISTGALAPSSAVGSVSPLTDPHKIEQLAAHAYVWGLPAEFV